MPLRIQRRPHRAEACKPRPARQRGVGLIEVMVAILVLSVGLFGVVLSQLNSLRSQRNAHLRATAVQMASDMAERMRLNTEAIGSTSTAYADPATTTYASLAPGTGASPPSAPILPAPFSADSQASYDLAAWRYEISRRLGSTTATGVVRETPGQPMGRTVVVMWLDAQPTSALKTAALTKRAASCPTGGGADALVCDPACPTDATVTGAPMNLRCIQIGVQP